MDQFDAALSDEWEDCLPLLAEVHAKHPSLTIGVTADTIAEFGGPEAFVFKMAAPEQGCCCDPCSLCEAGKEHEVPLYCDDYTCLTCEARELLSDPVVKFDGLAAWFLRETGFMRPGKSVPAAMHQHTDEERRAAWVAWWEEHPNV